LNPIVETIIWLQLLQELYDACGGTTPEVLALSIELDELMNEYEKKQFRVRSSGFQVKTF
jgi:hypothetical protein